MTSRLPYLHERKTGDHLRPPLYEELREGEDYTPVSFVPDVNAVEAYCNALGIDGDAYLKTKRTAPSGLVMKELMWLYMTHYDRSTLRGVHVHETARFHAEIPLGAPLVFKGRVREKYLKRGRKYFINESEAYDIDGRLLVSQANTEIIEFESPATVQPSEKKDAGAEQKLAPAIPTVDQTDIVAEREVTATREGIGLFSGVMDGFRSIHSDPLEAVRQGFPDVVAQGMMGLCWLSEMAYAELGMQWARNGNITGTFLKPILAGSRFDARLVRIANDLTSQMAMQGSLADQLGNSPLVSKLWLTVSV
ncbi:MULTISPECIES: MaoC/PaaZ C-terminal domain-containing protein [Sinorhizobium]|uniref:MaoC/PaaZ C-terminal domain-containing protein n=1 Tax=Sinorhizobium TaxID=28105 RepID=UPI0013048638|nr:MULTISPECIES: MaoC/PaaZ C-terminal domain-containing protein [Sinorhizobium]